MAIPQILIDPDASQYSIGDVDKVIFSNMSGPKVYSAGVKQKPGIAVLTWKCTKNEYSYIMAFYRRKLDYGVLKFCTYLILDKPDAELYDCLILPNKFHLIQQSGNMYILQAEVLVLGLHDG